MNNKASDTDSNEASHAIAATALRPEIAKIALTLNEWLTTLFANNGGHGRFAGEFSKGSIKRLELTETYVAADFAA